MERVLTARHVNRVLLDPINRSAPENSISTLEPFSETESINSKEQISGYESCHLRSNNKERRLPFEN